MVLQKLLTENKLIRCLFFATAMFLTGAALGAICATAVNWVSDKEFESCVVEKSSTPWPDSALICVNPEEGLK